MTRYAVLLWLLLPRLGAAGDALVAFSLQQAEIRIKVGPQPNSEVEKLAGITRLLGLVYDRDSRDVILIGRAEAGQEPLELANLATALRAVNVLHQWPLVSIDPTPETLSVKKQAVRFEGGIANTAFAKALLDADIALKGMGIGTLHLQALKLPSYFDFRAESAKRRPGGIEGSSRLWFYAIDPLLEQREDIFAIRELSVGVRAQAVGPANRDEAADRFSKVLTEAYDVVARSVPEVRGLRGLFEMVALAQGVTALPEGALSYWLKDYAIPTVETPAEFGYVVRRELLQTVEGIRALEVGGGIQMQVLAIRLQDGDITALKEAVLLTRPVGALSWRVPLEQWELPGADTAPQSTGSPSPSEADAGTSLDWRFLAQPDGTGKKLYDPFIRVSAKDVTIVDPYTDERYVIDLNTPARAAHAATPTAGPKPQAAAIRSILADLENEMKARTRNLAEIPLVEEAPKQGSYHTGADGLNYRNENSLERPPAKPGTEGMYHVGADGNHYLNQNSLEKPPDQPGAVGSYHTGADGLNYRNENSLEKTGATGVSSGASGTASKPSSSGGGFLCITASCLGSPQKTADGLKAVPYAYGNLDPYSFNRFFNAGWTVSSGDKVVGSYGDVRLLGGGLYAAKEMNGYGYRVYNSAGRSLTQVYPDVQSLGGTGYFAVTGIDGIGMTTIMDKNLKPVHSVPTYDLNNYVRGYGFQQEVQKHEALAEQPAPVTTNPGPAPSQKTISGSVSVPLQAVAPLSTNPPLKAADRGGVKADIKVDELDFAPSRRRQK